MEKILERVQTLITDYGMSTLGAIAVFILGIWLAKFLSNSLRKLLRKRKVDETLVTFLGSLTHVLLLIFVIIAGMSKLGVEMTSIIAMVGAAGLAVGLALQGSLANLAGGVLLFVFRPFRVGHFVEAAGNQGTVEEIDIFTTKLKTFDNKTIIIPNAKVTGDTIVNYSMNETRRVDLVIGVSYGDDLDKVKNVIKGVLSEDPRILKDPQPMVAVIELADSSVNFAVRPWVKTSDYWDVYFGTIEAIKKRLDREGITIPFPQHDVHMYSHEEGAA
jgi:small conductance mechanosensitive channel